MGMVDFVVFVRELFFFLLVNNFVDVGVCFVIDKDVFIGGFDDVIDIIVIMVYSYFGLVECDFFGFWCVGFGCYVNKNNIGCCGDDENMCNGFDEYVWFWCNEGNGGDGGG